MKMLVTSRTGKMDNARVNQKSKSCAVNKLSNEKTSIKGIKESNLESDERIVMLNVLHREAGQHAREPEEQVMCG